MSRSHSSAPSKRRHSLAAVPPVVNTRPTGAASKTRVKSYYAAYGGKVTLGKIYGELVLIVTVPPKRERDTSPELG